MLNYGFSGKKNLDKNYRDVFYQRRKIFILVAMYVIHYFHRTDRIVGYAQDLQQKLSGAKNLIPVFAHNLFSFDFFFVVRSIRLCVWHTKQLNIGEKKLANVQYANVGLQVKFIDTIKYYSQSLSSLAKRADENEKTNIERTCQKFIYKTQNILAAFNSLSDENKKLVLDYLSGGKGATPCEKIKSHEDLNYVPENEVFSKTEF